MKILAEIYSCIPDLNSSELFAKINDAVKDLPERDRVYSLAFISKPLIGMDLLRRKGASASVRQKAHSLVERIESEDRKHTIPQSILMAEEGADV